MFWGITAVLTGLFFAAYSYLNQIVRLPVEPLMVWRGVGVAILSAPIALMAPLPDAWWFLPLLVFQGCLIAFADGRTLHAATLFGAGPPSRVAALIILTTAILWWLVDPARFMALTEDPVRLTGVIVCLITATIAAASLSRGEADRKVLLYFLPVVAVVTLINIGNKQAMMAGPLKQVAPWYIFATSLTAGLIHMVRMRIANTSFKEIATRCFNKQYFAPGLTILPLVTMTIACKNHAMQTAPNPAYVAAIVQLYPVWILLANKFVGHKDDTDVKAGIGLVAAGVLLMILTG